MKLIYKITLRLAAILLPIMALWAVVFYYTMVEEINDESDDSLVEYAETIIRRQLAGETLPPLNNGSNNSYSIVPYDGDTTAEPYMIFYDEMVYIPEQEDTEPARILETVFIDRNDSIFKLTVSMPTFERDDLQSAIFWYILILYILLVLVVLLITTLIFYQSMRPLYAMLAWLDKYVPGCKADNIPDSSVVEFHKLSIATQKAVNRAEEHFEQQKQFIGNASHELQTPLAVIGNRIEWLTDNTTLNEEQFTELAKIRESLSRLVRLNRTLLLLTKIDNGQILETSNVDIATLLRDEVNIYNDIYAEKGIMYSMDIPEEYILHINESLASTLITNLLKNAFIHSPQGAKIGITLRRDRLVISNNGTTALNEKLVFERFYHKGNNNSTGLGLALVDSICRHYGFKSGYTFKENEHHFFVNFK